MFVLPFPNIDPALFSVELFGITLSLRWYALAYLAGLVLGWRYVAWLMKRRDLWRAGPPAPPEAIEDLLTLMVLGVVVGGRLGFVLFYQPAHYLSHPLQILAVWQGGMAFHGGLLGAVAAVAWFARARKAPVMEIGDAVAAAAPIGLLLGRIANFINAELWGRATDVPWAMVFPGAGDAPRHPSQLYQAGLEGAALFVALWWLATRRGWLRTPGALIGTFLIGYGAARVAVETVRQPDAFYSDAGNPLGFAWQWGPEAGMTMGQILSVPMIAVGAAVLIAARRGRWARAA